jgi:hypothetical protein
MWHRANSASLSKQAGQFLAAVYATRVVGGAEEGLGFRCGLGLCVGLGFEGLGEGASLCAFLQESIELGLGV